MTERTSLFAQKLRAYRIGRAGHGRMTQEELAAALDVSVDAISKYERSLSYIRGDLENRLMDVLGWSREDIIACREDWEAHRPRQSGPRYQLLKNQEILKEFGDSATAVIRAVATMETEGSHDWPSGFSAGDTIWRDIQRTPAIMGPYVMNGSDMVGHVGLIFPGTALEESFRARTFDEGKLSPDLLKRPLLPGTYFAYCPAIYVATGHEQVARILLSGFVEILEDLAEREVFIREIGAIAVNALGKQLCDDLGLRFIGQHATYPEFGVWSLSGEKIASSILGRRSAKLRQAYQTASF